MKVITLLLSLTALAMTAAQDIAASHQFLGRDVSWDGFCRPYEGGWNIAPMNIAWERSTHISNGHPQFDNYENFSGYIPVQMKKPNERLVQKFNLKLDVSISNQHIKMVMQDPPNGFDILAPTKVMIAFQLKGAAKQDFAARFWIDTTYDSNYCEHAVNFGRFNIDNIVAWS